MTTDHGIKYKTYFLHCDPMKLTSGRFNAGIVIKNSSGATEKTPFEFPALDDFSSEKKAIEEAAKWGRRWVDAHP